MAYIHRMPVEFGPSLGPRQGLGGRRFNGELSRATLFTVQCLTAPVAMAKLLPAAFSPADEPLVTLRVHYNHSLAWLAGRAYNYIEVMFRSVFHGRQDQVEGDFTSKVY